LLEGAREAVCSETLIGLGLSASYRDFHQLSDAEVTDLLAPAPSRAEGAHHSPNE
jgi:predicted phosphoribosyltransferase